MQLEAQRDALLAAMSAPDYYTTHSAQEIKGQNEAVQDLDNQINRGYQRWEELEEKKTAAENQ